MDRAVALGAGPVSLLSSPGEWSVRRQTQGTLFKRSEGSNAFQAMNTERCSEPLHADYGVDDCSTTSAFLKRPATEGRSDCCSIR